MDKLGGHRDKQGGNYQGKYKGKAPFISHDPLT
jgi:hypothetical protein